MENKQKIEFKSLDDLCYLPQEELNRPFLRNIVGMYAGLQREIGINIPLLSSFRICYIWPATIPWEIIPKGVTIGFAR
jgi:hypothetical protein